MKPKARKKAKAPEPKPVPKAKPKTKPKPKEKTMADDKPAAKAASTPAPAEKPAEKPAGGLSAADLKTEQEKGKPDPVSPAEPSPGPVKTIEEEGIGSRQPYPTKDGG